MTWKRGIRQNKSTSYALGGLNAGFDQSPEIQLARIVLRPSRPTNGIALALNVPIEETVAGFAEKVIKPQELIPPKGCVRDLDPSKGEHRRVTFGGATDKGSTLGALFSVKTEIVHPPGQEFYEEKTFKSDDAAIQQPINLEQLASSKFSAHFTGVR